MCSACAQPTRWHVGHKHEMYDDAGQTRWQSWKKALSNHKPPAAERLPTQLARVRPGHELGKGGPPCWGPGNERDRIATQACCAGMQIVNTAWRQGQ